MLLPPEILKKILLKSGLISGDIFDDALKEAKRAEKPVVNVLISRGLLTSDYYANLLSNYFHVPRVRLTGYHIPLNILQILPENVARTHNAIVFNKKDHTLEVALLNPTDLDTLDFLEKYTGYFIKPYLALEEDLQEGFAQYGKTMSGEFQKTIEQSIRASLKLKGVEAKKAALEVPIVSLTDNLVSYAASLNATDIHIEPLANEVLVRFRIDGILREIVRLAKEIQPAIIARIKILANLQLDEHRKPQDGRFRYKYANTSFDIRVAIMPTLYGEKVEMRLLAGSTKPMSLTSLGMGEATKKIVEYNLKKTTGIILVTGPTGCGKTTTLYAMLNILNRPEVNIVTIEDPIEYELKYVNQTQVNQKAGVTFANGLRAILRQDPNIIMVGEIRDRETAEIATHAALTGHLVLSTLHTNDAATAVPRLRDMGIPAFLISSTLNLVIAQRLVRRICRHCIESYTPSTSVYKTIDKQLKTLKGDLAKSYHPDQLYRGKGCPYCNFTGYKGRIAIYEALNVDESIRNYIQTPNFSLDGLKKIAFQEKMSTMFEDGLQKAELGITTIEEVLRVTRE